MLIYHANNVKMPTIVGILTFMSPPNLRVGGYIVFGPGHVAQSVTSLAKDAYLTADPGVASSIPYFRED